ncbi:MAG: hypothetical protein A3E83_08190 [Gammaproteobacteria bacterium RIFCSPHIGHO2_12_FULL_41_20]|nr:MAG: hypothetical protein A3E83_08190 [Gammaproteobacteria bacterium RIFCSPHIGHO2_12_FULL_41_20]
MAPAKKFHSILNTIASLTANFIMNRGFLVATLVGLKDAFSTCFKSAKNFFGNTGAIFLSILTALTAAAIAYNAFLLFGAAVAVFPATINFVLYFATGFVGMRSIAKKIHDARSPDARFQRECLDKLKHIKSDYLTSINEFLTQQQVNETLLELQQPDLPVARRTELQDKMQSILKTLLQDKLTALATLGEVIKNKTNGELAKEWAATIFDITVATSIFLPFFATFTEAGFRGVEIITKMAGSNALEKIHQAGKIAIGFVPGLLSSLYYAFVTASCRSALIGLMQRLYHHPTEIPGALLFLTFGGLSGTGMENVSSGIVNSNNIFSLTPNSTVSQMYVVLNALGAADVNTTLMLGETYLRQQDVLPGRSLDNLINYFAAEDHPLSPSTVKQLRAVGLFGSSAPPTAPSHQYQRMSDDEEAALPLDATRAAMPAS